MSRVAQQNGFSEVAVAALPIEQRVNAALSAFLLAAAALLALLRL